MKPILDIAKSIDLEEADIEPYGSYVAKITPAGLEKRFKKARGRYIVVTAMTPTSQGEGKTTVAIGLGMAMWRLKRKAIITLRQPSLGPLFGMKGGGAGGGASRLLPHDSVNLALTGDSYRVTAAHNLLSSFIDNHILRKSAADIDPDSLFWPRAVDVNDRALREIIVGAQENKEGFPHPGRFVLTEASEIMAILSLSSSLKDMRARLGRIIVSLDNNGQPVTAESIRCSGAMAVILRDAMRPNLIQTSEGTPVMVHTGPFANIAPGVSSLIADHLALTISDYVITEAGFGADLGFEKLVDIKCRTNGLYPDAAVLVCTMKSLKAHGGNPDGGLREIDEGMKNLNKQIENVKCFNVPLVVAINRHEGDRDEEIEFLKKRIIALNVGVSCVDPWRDGGSGLMELGELVEEVSTAPPSPRFLYELDSPVEDKIKKIAVSMYGAEDVEFSESAMNMLHLIKKFDLESLPVCMAKTHRSLSHDPKQAGAPAGFNLPIDDIQIAAGAGFIYPLCGKIYPLPGLPSKPLGEDMDVNTETWEIEGLY